MNPKTLSILTRWAALNNKKLRNVKKIYLKVPLKDRPAALEAIAEDIDRILRNVVADKLEDSVNLCKKCSVNKYPLCKPSNAIEARGIVVKCGEFKEVGKDDTGTENKGSTLYGPQGEKLC